MQGCNRISILKVMAIQVHRGGLNYAKKLIRDGKVNRNVSWSFSASDGNALLGEDNDDWMNFARFHLAVDTEEGKDTKGRWKYPYGKNGQVYRRGVIAAKSRAAAEGETGIVSATDELLNMIDKDEKSKLRELLEKALNVLTGTPNEEKVEEDTAVQKSGFIVRKGIDGKNYWFAWVTNKWLDRHDQIITNEAHKEFLQYLDENPEDAPELWVWHTPGTAREYRASWWDYANGFFVYCGELTDEEAEQYEDEDDNIGMSHGFYVLQYDFEKRHIMKYRTFEVSELPRDMAANPYTYFETIQEENTKMFDSKRRQYLVNRFGEDTVAKLEGDTESREKALLDLGVSMKQIETDWQEAYEKELSERIAKASEASAEKIVKSVVGELAEVLNMEELQKTLTDLFAEVDALKEKVKAVEGLKEEVAHLKETEDTKIANAITPIQPINWGRSATTSKSNIVVEDDLEEEVKKQVNSAKKQVSGWMNALRPDGGVA